MIIEVVRLGQRLVRDDRVTTHAALVSRAFGASRIYMSEAAEDIPGTIHKMNRAWGGSFEAVVEPDPFGVIRRKKDAGYAVVHLTMYGRALNEYLKSEDAPDKMLVVIGASKVPPQIYRLADYNVAVGSQPHSEIAALAVFLDRVQGGSQLDRALEGAARRIIPTEFGKRVVDL